jgi:hypothetical protein
MKITRRRRRNWQVLTAMSMTGVVTGKRYNDSAHQYWSTRPLAMVHLNIEIYTYLVLNHNKPNWYDQIGFMNRRSRGIVR